ncbi:MAG TPA: nucleoside hydrolase [Candidatus Acidoferrum sp.]|nr:nucleoside hydrolase [Candidatus Acidoferrum sp.]
MLLRQKRIWISPGVALSRANNAVASSLKLSSVLGISLHVATKVVARFPFIALIIFACALFNVSCQASVRKIILDTDPGTDDAMALMLALNSPELDVRAITVVPGNVTAEQGLENALRMVSLANRCDIPVAGGARHPLFQKLITAEFWHGKNGLANIELPRSKCKADARFGPDLIIELIHASPHEITLVPVGPLTNIALAVERDPSIVPLIKEVIMMGGSIKGGNVNAAAEANIYNDPEAAQIVFQAGWPLTMVGLDVGDKTLLGRKQLEQLASTHGPVNDFIYGVAKFLVGLSEKFGDSGTPMYDPLAVGVAIDSMLVTAPAMHVDVETRGEFTRGETVANRRNEIERNVLHGDRYIIEGVDKVEPNARVCVEVQAERFLQLFVSRIQGK